jgi:hypothetical protein
MNAADVGAVVVVGILGCAGLAGAGQVRRGGRDAVGVAGTRSGWPGRGRGVRVAAGHGDRRCGAVCRDDLAGDPRLGRLVFLAGAHRPAEQPGAGHAGDAGCGAGLLQARGGGEGCWRRPWPRWRPRVPRYGMIGTGPLRCVRPGHRRPGRAGPGLPAGRAMGHPAPGLPSAGSRGRQEPDGPGGAACQLMPSPDLLESRRPPARPPAPRLRVRPALAAPGPLDQHGNRDAPRLPQPGTSSGSWGVNQTDRGCAPDCPSCVKRPLLGNGWFRTVARPRC